MIVAPDGYILSVLGLYFADGRNNDAAILEREYQRDVNAMRQWFQDGDIFLIDRGYRDVLPWLEQLRINCWMPALRQNGEQ